MAVRRHDKEPRRRTGQFLLCKGMDIRTIGNAGEAAKLLRRHVHEETGIVLGNSPDGVVMVTHEPAMRGLGEDGYALLVSPNAIMLRAATPAGLLHGVEQLRRLLSPGGRVPAVDLTHLTAPAVAPAWM
ncbi:Glycosyl hydrolase family 20, domain 2 [Lentzea waywayandensis]|uniref:Glycosyl hydrolase family 20, domain 2 n=1 Tax=Lentzea waywayandensis TaxID=84724 RepID=A0A1I6F7A3_9PSEU|nr:glycoside hydrolase family 20 zincin-like fold domain-containing protein [Lentzea waywayandensis]SFR25816.1 Glycosyl hydrolase family 20, domain 2 [Lentzea waywayandensis]